MPGSAPRRTDVDAHLPLKAADFFVLVVLRDGPMHGYGIVRSVARRTDERVRLRPGNLYRVLDRMLDAGLLEVAERRPARDVGDERRTYYRITALGRRVLAAEATLLAPLVADVLGVPATGWGRA
ncbi:MAG TPA: helix-turn-helix transcriptional regulator [Gemmatimonadaceae bacterium]|nr:helix-turn-helix transcriptional regulator [Gemmatimonadaceae bacterium]